ncbi:GroES-like protein [Glonium stellatum]|uniref:GroES-like protein n=1 Tax=Glonium stellatum TaxID=574774 RepID=A0A8E2JVJ3_9PEZI|nr:GroES-like protein [Glonium stellatum]
MQTMKAWLYNTTTGGLEKNLYLPTLAPKPQLISPNQILVEVISMGLNPTDYKIPELGLVAKAVIPTPASPGLDFCGRVAATGNTVDSLRIGELVWGRLDGPTRHGTLGQFVIASATGCVPLPDGVDPDQAAGLASAGITAYQSIVPNVKKGDRVFINGGSGGTGIFGIQIAKIKGCHVTTTCSAANMELCKSLGADEVIDYTSVDVCQALKEKGEVFGLAVDNVGAPADLYKASSSFLLPLGKFVQVGAEVSWGATATVMSNFMVPSFLGGGKRKYEFISVKNKYEDLNELATWLKEGKLKSVIDSAFEFEDAPKAFEKLKKGRAKGKIVVHVTKL